MFYKSLTLRNKAIKSNNKVSKNDKIYGKSSLKNLKAWLKEWIINVIALKNEYWINEIIFKIMRNTKIFKLIVNKKKIKIIIFCKYLSIIIFSWTNLIITKRIKQINAVVITEYSKNSKVFLNRKKI